MARNSVPRFDATLCKKGKFVGVVMFRLNCKLKFHLRSTEMDSGNYYYSPGKFIGPKHEKMGGISVTGRVGDMISRKIRFVFSHAKRADSSRTLKSRTKFHFRFLYADVAFQ